MKKLILFFALAVLSYQGYSQATDTKTFTDIALAKANSKKQNVPILMVFAGSDWCKPCIQFKRSILTSETFTAYAKQNLTVLYLDFPSKKINQLTAEQTAHNEKLAEKFNPSGAFPEILMIDSNEKILGKLEYKNQSPEAFITSCKALIK